MSPIASAVAGLAIAAHAALFGWGVAQAKPALRRRALPVLAVLLVTIMGAGALGAWHDRTHIDVGEQE